MKQKILLLAFLLTPTMLSAQWTDEYGTWVSLGAKKSLGTKWSLGLEAEYRAQENSRWAVGVDAGYKLNKLLKFGVGYTLLYNRKKAKQEGDPAVDDEYSIRPAYAYPRHRFLVEATADKRFWKWLRISLRERYQLTYRPANDHDKIEYYKVIDEDWNESWGSETEVKTKPALTTQLLRSRLKFEVDKKGWKFSPYVSAEACNSVSCGDHMQIDKVRTTVGTGYKISKSHEISLGYVLTFVFNDDDELNDKVEFNNRIHAVSVGYNYKF